MPKRNRINLRDLCFQIISNELELMKNLLIYLPYNLITELYERKNYFKLDVKKLPMEILLNRYTTKLVFEDILNFPDRKVTDKITDKMYNWFYKIFHEHADECIQRVCENCSVNYVTYIDLSFCNSVKPSLQTKLIEHFHQIQILKVVKFGSDQLLAAISRHCTQLLYLDTSLSSKVTDVGIESLCFNNDMKLNYLDIVATQVTASGCLHTLKNMKFLKIFRLPCWDELFEMLKLEINSTPAYSSIEEISCIVFMGSILNEEKLNIATVAFPNLRTLRMSEINFNHIVVRNYLEKITNLTLETENIDINLVGFCCPILENLQLDIINFTTLQNDWSIPNHTPFKRLRSLYLHCSVNVIPKNDLRLLLANCLDLKLLQLVNCQTLTDDFFINMIKVNPLYHLTVLMICGCHNISVISLMAVLQKDNFLSHVYMNHCPLITEFDLTQLQSYIVRNNLNVVVDLDNDEQDDE